MAKKASGKLRSSRKGALMAAMIQAMAATVEAFCEGGGEEKAEWNSQSLLVPRARPRPPTYLNKSVRGEGGKHVKMRDISAPAPVNLISASSPTSHCLLFMSFL